MRVAGSPDYDKTTDEYILPRYSEGRQGRVRVEGVMVTADDDVLRMNRERFCVPEVLFRPSDIGMHFWGSCPCTRSEINLL